MILKRFTDWQERVIDESLKKDHFVVSCAKAFGVGGAEGTILGCAAVGGMYIIVTTIKLLKRG